MIYRRNKLIKCKRLSSAEMASALIDFHALTAADAVSGSYGQSKKTNKQIQKYRKGQQILLNIGKNGNISQTDINIARRFAIKYMCIDKTSCNLAQARAKNWKQMKTKTTLGVPPDEDSFY